MEMLNIMMILMTYDLFVSSAISSSSATASSFFNVDCCCFPQLCLFQPSILLPDDDNVFVVCGSISSGRLPLALSSFRFFLALLLFFLSFLLDMIPCRRSSSKFTITTNDRRPIKLLLLLLLLLLLNSSSADGQSLAALISDVDSNRRCRCCRLPLPHRSPSSFWRFRTPKSHNSLHA